MQGSYLEIVIHYKLNKTKQGNTMKASKLCTAIAACLFSQPLLAQTDQQRIEALEEQVEALAAAYESSESKSESKVHIGGYGELLYHNLDRNGVDDIELNFRRFVMFFGYDFNDKARFVSELEVENTFVSASSRGAVELEQAYLEFDLQDNISLKTGIILMPIGIISETHEPGTFYGAQRPIIERTIIPTTWWGGGVALNHRFANGLSYDVFLSEGLKTDDPSVSLNSEPFNLKGGKQKTSFADMHDLALTGRIKYTGKAGMEIATYAQYQPDLDQSAINSYADSAYLLGGHGIYQFGDFKATALYAMWTVDGDAAKAAGKDKQDGGYVELSYRPIPKLGFFVRQNQWSQERGIDKSQTDAGFNYWPYENIVFKFDVQIQNDDAKNEPDPTISNLGDGFNLGMGYQF